MDEPQAADFADMALALQEEPTVADTVDRVAEFARDVLECDHAGVLFAHARGQIETAAATDALVSEIDQLQMSLGDGPCIDAIWEMQTIVVPDTATDQRWPKWASRVAEMGIASILGIRLFTPHRTLGALNLYCTKIRHFDEDDIAVADIFARHASIAVQTATEEADLWRAIDARHLVGQAQGILMERFGLNTNQAFAVLRRYSQDRNLKLRAVAEQVVNFGRLPGDR